MATKTTLSEDDIPGASLSGRNPSLLKTDELRFWLKCRGDRGKWLKTKAQLVKRVQEYVDSGRDKNILDPDPQQVYTRRKERLRDSSDRNPQPQNNCPSYPSTGWSSSLRRMPIFTKAEMNIHIAQSELSAVSDSGILSQPPFAPVFTCLADWDSLGVGGFLLDPETVDQRNFEGTVPGFKMGYSSGSDSTDTDSENGVIKGDFENMSLSSDTSEGEMPTEDINWAGFENVSTDGSDEERIQQPTKKTLVVEPDTKRHNEPKFIVFYSMLLSLFSMFCFQCRRDEQENENTKKKTKQNVTLLEEFLVLKEERRKIEEIPPQELNVYLSEFIITVRKKENNEEYEPNSIRSLIANFERHLKKKNYGFSFMKDLQFEQTRKALQSKQKDLKRKGKGNKPNASVALSEDDIKVLYEKELLGTATSEALTIWFNNTVHFGLRGCKEHRDMCWGDVKLCKTWRRIFGIS
ncbi:hypothetical protein QZH41_005506 [Actinostola sp. cb2023]|nr:hypothetical protein QZH41_005506 [Actinostola sp. cb2023]